MKTYSKFEDVDIISTLRKIMLHNTRNYQTDFEYDIGMLTGAAQSGVAHRSFLWMSRDDGTWCFPARDVYMSNTPAHHTWSYYSFLDNVKAFWIELDGVASGVVKGTIAELDHQKHVENIGRNNHWASAVEITFRHPHHVKAFDIVEYNELKKSILARHGTVETMEYLPADENALRHILNTARDELLWRAQPNDIDVYVKEMEREHFHNYGYTKGDMVFTAPADADNALRRGLPVYALHHDGSATQMTQREEVADHVYADGIFGMNRDMKDFLDYLAHNHSGQSPFSQDELDLLYRSVVFAGEGNDALSAGELRHMERLLFKLDTILHLPGERDVQITQEPEAESGMEV